MNPEQIKQLCLKHGYKLQEDGTLKAYVNDSHNEAFCLAAAILDHMLLRAVEEGLLYEVVGEYLSERDAENDVQNSAQYALYSWDI